MPDQTTLTVVIMTPGTLMQATTMLAASTTKTIELIPRAPSNPDLSDRALGWPAYAGKASFTRFGFDAVTGLAFPNT